MNTLFTWLGNKDLENMRPEQNAAISTIAIKSGTPFDKIVILANKDEGKWSSFEKYLKKKMAIIGRPSEDIKIYNANISSPIDYPSIAIETEQWLDKLSEQSETLSINLTSGTPAMSTLSVLIGKGKTNIRFVQATPKNELIETNIPIDFGKEYVKSASKSIASKASSMPKSSKAFDGISAKSEAMKEVISKAKIIAKSELPTLILGDTGTGKEVMAKAIHDASLRAGKPIRAVNCGAFPESIIESTLFGHVKGAFTGASEDKLGLFEQVDGGTLFLDEVGELTPAVQVKLLRVLQEQEFERLGSNKTLKVDIRVIAATHRNLIEMVEKGDFREDLFYRLAVGIIKLPSLRERKEDITALVEHFTNEINSAGDKHPDYKSKIISEKGIKFINSQPWHGNIRELWNTLNRAFLWSEKQVVTDTDISDAMIVRAKKSEGGEVTLSLGQTIDLNENIELYKKKYILAALKATGNSLTKTKDMLGFTHHQTLKGWMEKLGIEIPK